jgi:hypothetical protein
MSFVLYDYDRAESVNTTGPGIVTMHHPSTGQDAYAPARFRTSSIDVDVGSEAPGDHAVPFQIAVSVLSKPRQNFAEEQDTPSSSMPYLGSWWVQVPPVHTP